MKKSILVIALSFLGSGIVAQNTFNCSSHDLYLKNMKDPEFRRNQERLEKETQDFIYNSAQKTNAATYIIPVVFHVIYTTPQGNISDAQIIDQIAILNKEFNRLQTDTVLTPTAFKSTAAPFSVEFRLATIDPTGKCTNGINRIYSSLSNCSYDEDDIKALSVWPSNMYLNIWNVQSMHYSSSMDCVGGGYATFPGGSASLDGVNIRGDLISNIGTAITNSQWGNFKGRYLIHELGHWFNLRHIWGDANCGNDLVSDTPPALTSNSGCPNFPHNPSSSCVGSNANGEMFTNYMDYTNGPCLNMFTAGQVARMTACINSPVSGRSNLWTTTNLNATGTNNPYTYPVACGATPDILPYGQLVICEGDSVKFTDHSYGGSSGTRLWSFTGGTSPSLTDSIVYVKYMTEGLYPVTLTKNYLSTSKIATFLDRVQVLSGTPNPNYVTPFNDSFESSSDFTMHWVVGNKDNDLVKWELVNSTSYLGTNCAAIMNYNRPAPLTDDLISPAYNLTAVQNPTLTFRLHFAGRVTANYDKLQVYVSNNCGKNWNMIYNKSSSTGLRTMATNITSSHIPNVAEDSEWRLEKINIANVWASGTCRFKFSFTSGGGNNIFIDDINLDGISTTGLTRIKASEGISVFPNPAKNDLLIKYGLKDKAPVKIEIVDVVGKICLMQNMDNVTASENTTALQVGTLKDGVYFVRIRQAGNIIYNTKFIKQSAE